jgi:uncharacterized SAM-binding protein YcdF (DUF218 family)
MFKSKYIFETRQTKINRYLKNSTLILVAFLIIYILMGIGFVRYSDNQSKFTEKALFNNPPDLVVVFTGGHGRIKAALKKAQEYKQPHIFITGVYTKNTVESLLKQYKNIETLDPNLFEIDYQAHNTLENVLSTLRYIKKNKNLQKIVVVSHDYHIARIKHIINTVKTNPDGVFYFYGINTDYSSFRNLKILYKEVYKYLRTCIFLIFWGVD